MRESNFSESQLQQAVNTAFIRDAFEKHGEWVFACVPSLFHEFHVGWDSGFYFPWYPHLPISDHEGCNFFIQYKLSGELTSTGAKEWKHWSTEYFRFKIPHSTKSKTGKFFDDYHQWDRLKDLANASYPTFYATNATLSKDDWSNALKAGKLLDETPLLDVRQVTAKHKHVTFTKSSTCFLLHSEIEDSPKRNFASEIERFSDNNNTSLDEANKKLLSLLKEMGKDDHEWSLDIQQVSQLINSQLPREIRSLRTHAFLASFIRKHLGAQMLWLPKNT
ncbi:MAG: hypothetical protein EWV58_05880 [Microcystis aeruginosa Ma_MB_F_20061100_S19]|nr:MAG: hypothetical protein EWV58_05880 [Microcystis aeruginosa Ma_MB_F_20061100_S19]